jgi:hypothetical protein
MAKGPRRPRNKQTARILGRAEEYLNGILIRVKLEGDKVVHFDPHEELLIPDAPREIKSEAKKAPARFAFWAYQAERVLAKVRELEAELDRAVAEADLIHRNWRAEEAGEYREGEIRSYVQRDKPVVTLRRALKDTREHYGLLRAIKDAHEHRCKILQGLLYQSSIRKERTEDG